MEDTLRVDLTTLFVAYVGSNPCFNGRYSQREKKLDKVSKVLGLNPCFNGRYSQRTSLILLRTQSCVLILVLMEDTLRAS